MFHVTRNNGSPAIRQCSEGYSANHLKTTLVKPRTGKPYLGTPARHDASWSVSGPSVTYANLRNFANSPQCLTATGSHA